VCRSAAFERLIEQPQHAAAEPANTRPKPVDLVAFAIVRSGDYPQVTAVYLTPGPLVEPTSFLEWPVSALGPRAI